jgi:hypothetical protein
MRFILQIMADISIDEATGQEWDLVVRLMSLFLRSDDKYKCECKKYNLSNIILLSEP